ncbi:MAG: hypothetical protein IJ489_11270 [Clostridia bacterium]|nr:hypothetical protein [Clostridia bacterium]
MAESKKIPSTNTEKKSEKPSLIDDVYMKYTKGVLRALSDTAFYEYFMDAIASAENEIQFSNRRMEKLIDESWIEAIEEALPGLQNIISNPRNVIQEEELIVNVGLARKSDSATVRHLAQHGSKMIDDFDEPHGEVNPNKLMQKLRDDSTVIYENRLTITVLENAYHFVKIRYEALMNTMSDEYGAKLKLTSNVTSATELLHTDLFVHIKQRDDILATDDKHRAAFDRIARLNRVLSSFMTTPFAQSLIKASRVKGSIVKTNVLKKNPNYKAIVKLYEFLHHYQDVGYAIKITEQSPVINEDFQRDIFHSVLFNYIILKNYLEDESDRVLPTPAMDKKRTLKPKFIKKIIEEMTEDYDLPDLEIRKVLIEELTKEQLMAEEEEQRRKLVEEQEQRKKEEEERIRREQEAEEERLRIEKEKEEERIRKEQEEEQRRLEVERLERDIEDRRRGKFFKDEMAYFFDNLEKRLALREKDAEARRIAAQNKEFEDAAKLLEEQERRKREEAERVQHRQEEIRERIKHERMMAEERAAQEALLRKAAEAARLEEERLAKEKAQKEKDEAAIAPYANEMNHFKQILENQIAERRNARQAQAHVEELRVQEAQNLAGEKEKWLLSWQNYMSGGNG